MTAAEHRKQELLLLLLLLLLAATSPGSSSQQKIMCKTIAINQGDYQRHQNTTKLYEQLKARVAGCQYILGDLHIKDIGIDPFTEKPLGGDIRLMSTDFLDSIEEITGQLFVFRVNLRVLALRNLRAIRGYNQLDRQSFYSMELAYLPHPIELQLPHLSAIVQGQAMLIGRMHESLYCSLSRQVEWQELFQTSEQVLVDKVLEVVAQNDSNGQLLVNASDACAHALPPCDDACPEEAPSAGSSDLRRRRLCWSPGPRGCQSSHRCRRRNCFSRLCFRDAAKNDEEENEECCHTSCIGGCSSNSPEGCFSCRSVSFDGACMESCPSSHSRYDPGKNVIVKVNISMLQVGNVCVKSCPAPFLTGSSGRYCLSECPSRELPRAGACRPCVDAGPGACRSCDLRTSILTDAEASRLRADGCAVWRLADNFLDVNAEKLDSAASSLRILGQLRYLYSGLLVKGIKAQSGIDFLGNLTFVSGNFALMNIRARYLGLVSLDSAKSFALSNIEGLCPAWYPTGRLEQLRKSFPIRELSISFDNASDECAAARCHPECSGGCWGPGAGLCVGCRNYRIDGRCYGSCRDVGRYAWNGSECGFCHQQCLGGCSGPDATDCVACRGLSEQGACVASCSPGLRPDSQGRCYSRSWLAGICSGAVLLLLLAVSLPLAILYYRRRIAKYETVNLDEYLTDPTKPSDMAKLLIVNDDDVLKQREIGSGAFGTVYKGVLRSATTRGPRELPVAIKVLHGRNPKLGQDLLNEASVLARVQHPYCIRLVALCLTQEPQLITALMPRGCLLDFLRSRRHRISSGRMLRWSQQVAEGMAYLESEGIIHRDLAARNVLLQTPDHVRITDFGLAHLLNISESEFANTAGLLPVKWLGLESIESGTFSHRSDVWSYGVLLWEICTFGEAPYRSYGIRSVEDMVSLLRKGIRLEQPDTCTVDFYNLILSCWLPSPESRPSFKELHDSIGECMEAPAKFIAAGARDGAAAAAAAEFEDDDDQAEHRSVDGGRAETAAAAAAADEKGLQDGAGYNNAYIEYPSVRSPEPTAAAADEDRLALLLMATPHGKKSGGGDLDGYLVPKSSPEQRQPGDQALRTVSAAESRLEANDYLVPNGNSGPLFSHIDGGASR